MVAEKKRIALTSLAAAIMLTAIKLIVGLKTNSMGILSEAAHSGLDLFAAIITYIAVSIADKPADKDHHFGHGKVENVSAFAETLLLIITCAWIIWEAGSRLITGSSHVDASIWGFGVIAFAIVVDFSRSRALYKVARKYNSQALEADALHFSSDIWSSLVVLSGLVFVRLGFPWVDSVAAIGVAIIVLFVSYRLGRRTIDALVDRVPKGIYENIFAMVSKISGVEKIKNLRLRASGANLFIDLTVAIKRIATFYQAHHVMDNVETAIRAAYPNADIIVHGEPLVSDDETIADKVRMIVTGSGLADPHSLRVDQVGDKYHIDFHIEHEKGMMLEAAHELTTDIEKKIRDEIGENTIISIHMEEQNRGEQQLVDTTASNNALVDNIRRLVRANKKVLDCRDILLLKAGDRYNLSLTCVFLKTSTLEEVHHLIDGIEQELRRNFGFLNRITIHAEPAP